MATETVGGAGRRLVTKTGPHVGVKAAALDATPQTSRLSDKPKERRVAVVRDGRRTLVRVQERRVNGVRLRPYSLPPSSDEDPVHNLGPVPYGVGPETVEGLGPCLLGTVVPRVCDDLVARPVPTEVPSGLVGRHTLLLL